MSPAALLPALDLFIALRTPQIGVLSCSLSSSPSRSARGASERELPGMAAHERSLTTVALTDGGSRCPCPPTQSALSAS